MALWRQRQWLAFACSKQWLSEEAYRKSGAGESSAC